MKVSEYLSPTGKQVLVILGDGKKDERVVRELALKFNGARCTLVLIAAPHPHRPKRGLHALEALPHILHGGYKVDEVLFMVDKEHFDLNLKGVTEALRSMGSQIQEVKPVKRGNAWLIKGVHGSCPFNLYVAVAGREKCVDEEVQEAARALGLQGSNKRVLKKLRDADRKVLEECFTGLASVLSFLEDQCKESPMI